MGGLGDHQPEPARPPFRLPDWARFSLPFAIYACGSAALGAGPSYPIAYACMLTAVGAVAVAVFYRDPPFRPHWRVYLGVVFGIIGFALWIGFTLGDWEGAIAHFLPSWLQPQRRAGFDPFTSIESSTFRMIFIAIRLVGLAIVVPVIEEVFWRGFLIRWLIDADWRAVPIGKITPLSFVVVTALFASAHPEWIAAAAYAVLFNILYAWRADLWNCIVGHAVTNGLLAAYVLYTAEYSLW